MSGDQLAQARDDLALLESRTADLTANLHDLEAKLFDAQRVASAGGSLADVVVAQTYRDSAHGLLEHHRQEVEQARERLADAEQVAYAGRLLADSRQAFAVMQQSAQAHHEEAEQAEAALSQSLTFLAQAAAQHQQARRTIRAALQQIPADQRADWLAQIDPALTEANLSPWTGSGLSRDRFPLLDRLGVNR